jgi:hypothetical protein
MSTRIRLIFSFLLFVTTLTASGAGLHAQGAAKASHVAIFFEPRFPYYGVDPQTSPQEVARHLRENGVRAELLGEEALSDPKRFNADTFAVLVLPYGNTYPNRAFPVLRAFPPEISCILLWGRRSDLPSPS